MPYPRKRFAQHWLKDPKVHQAIVAAAGLEAYSAELLPTVLEIGPGTGQLTRRLLQTGAHLLAVEIDRDLCRLLHKSFADQPRFQLIEGDFLALPLPPEPTVLVANIPYNITSPILEKVLGSPEAPVTQFDRIVLLVQKELAERLNASPGSKAYGAMSIRIQYLADCQRVCEVPRRAFKPMPQVDSAVIVLQPRPCSRPAQDPHWFNVLVQQGFSMRRKMLVNTLQGLVEKEMTTQALQTLGLEPGIRAEMLDVQTWIALSDALLPYRKVEIPVVSS